MEAQKVPSRVSGWAGGLLLIALGLAIASSQLFSQSNDPIPAIVLAGIGMTFYILYRTNRERLWPLILTYIFWSASGGILLDGMLSRGGLLYFLRPLNDTITGFYIATVLSLPFLYAYRRTVKPWLLIFPAVALATMGGIALDEAISPHGLLFFLQPLEDTIAGTYIACVLSLPFLYAYRRTRKSWLLLFPWIALATVGGIALDEAISPRGLLFFLRPIEDAIVAIYIASVLSLPFLYAYKRSGKSWLLVFPWIALAAGVGVSLDPVMMQIPFDFYARSGDEILGAYIAFVLALPFLYVYLHDRSRRWAIVPTGILASIGFGFLIAGFLPLIPLVMVGFGLFLVVRYFAWKRLEDKLRLPKTGPEADRPPAV